MGVKVEPGDEVRLDGRPVRPETFEYYLLNKPAGVVSTVSDPRKRRTVVSFIPSHARLFPVGRLDYDTTGLIILTNDGELANALMHPRYQIDKVYQAEVKGAISEEHLQRLRRGIRLEDGLTAPAEARIMATHRATSEVELVIHQGRKRQVRRMLEAVGHPVIRLHRSGYAMLTCEGLKPGRFRSLAAEEVEALRKLASAG